MTKDERLKELESDMLILINMFDGNDESGDLSNRYSIEVCGIFEYWKKKLKK